MKRQRNGLTIIELLTVIGIIAILLGLLIPAVSMVRRMAKETQQRAQIAAIELAITTFKNDYGDYPPSSRDQSCEAANDYSGAQKLAEALCGWDLLGFHPNSRFRSDGKDCSSAEIYPDPLNPANPNHVLNLKARKGPYLDMASISVFTLANLFNSPATLESQKSHVICDVFGVRNVQPGGKIGKAGTPILYYKANTASKDHMTSAQYSERIYNYDDNKYLIALQTLTASGAAGKDHKLAGSAGETFFYDPYIRDTRAPIPWPYKPDSYILISAGADGEYGTGDDIRNF